MKPKPCPTRSETPITVFKLFRLRADGTLGSLFINRRDRLPLGRWLAARPHPTTGYAFRPYWHCTKEMSAPHMTLAGRVWCRVLAADWTEFPRPQSQGWSWILANRINILEVMA